jgi:enoyl-CoA hydratase
MSPEVFILWFEAVSLLFREGATIMELVQVSRSARVATLTMNRPEALNSAALDALESAVVSANADDDVYVIVITGSGRSFVAGADIGEMKDYNAVRGQAFGARATARFSLSNAAPSRS